MPVRRVSIVLSVYDDRDAFEGLWRNVATKRPDLEIDIIAVDDASHRSLKGAVMRSRLDYTTVPTVRGQRYSGKSKMNWVGLVTHGLSAFSVYADVIFVRLLVATAAIAGIALLGIAIAVFIRLATNLATPGWATTVVGVLLTVVVQMIVAVIMSTLSILSGRSNRPFVPKYDCAQFVAERIAIPPGASTPLGAAPHARSS